MVELEAGWAARQSVLAADLVGRDRERHQLHEALGRAAAGEGRVLFVSGEAGIGKSRLARDAAEQAAARGMRVLQGRAVATTTPVAYRPLAEALTASVRAGCDPGSDELVPFRPVLARLIPDWRDPGRAGADDTVLVLAEGVLRYLRAAADHAGCLLVLEDLHWADPETLAIVEFLADHLPGERVLCIATLRDETAGPAHVLAQTLCARRAAVMLELQRLDDEGVDLMLASCLGGGRSPEIRELAARAEGVPFLVEELLAVAVGAGALVHDGASWSYEASTDHVLPLTFADTVRRRLAAIGGPARRVLGAAAILGRRFDWKLLGPITGLDDDAVVAALRAAFQAQLVSRHDDRSFRFRHALSRDAVLVDLLAPERSSLAARALDAIERAHPGLPGSWCELAADVALASGDRERAATLLLEGGRRALDAGALATAGATLSRARALGISDQATMLEVEDCLAAALSLAGDHERVVEVCESLLRQLGDDPSHAPRRAQVRVRLARAASGAGRWEGCDDQLERAREEAASVSDEALVARIDIVAAQATILRRPPEAADLARAALDVARRQGLPEVACEALEIIGRHERARDLADAAAAFQAAYDLATARHLEVWRMRALHELGTVDLLRNGDVSRFEQARDLSVQLGAPSTTAVLDVQIGSILAVRDDPAPAIAVCQRAQALAHRYRLADALAAALAFEGVCHARAGDRTQVHRCVTEALEAGAGRAEVGYNVGFVRAQLALVLEDRPAALRAFLDATVDGSAAVGVEVTGPNGGMLALLLAAEGDDDGARRWLEQPGVHFIARGHARYAAAVLAGRAGHLPEALSLVDEGDAQLDGFGWYRHLGRRLVAEAALADGWGEPSCWLLDALAFFDRTGDARIASACRSLLRRAGTAVPRRRDPSPHPVLGPLGITAREAEVLGLLGEGLSNRDIGTRLYMSPRTVERHVANLCTKAGIGGRAELIAFAARLASETAPA